MSLQFHIDTPLLTIEEFSKRSGIPVSTIRKKVDASKLPTCDTRLNKDKRGAIYINMLKLAQLADNAEYLHPGMNGV